MGPPAAGRRSARSLAAAVTVAAALLAAGAGPAAAGVDHYCVGCTINGNSGIQDTNGFYLTLDYVHRLSGPSCTTIGARAYYGGGVWGGFAYNLSCSDDVQHGYNGSQFGYGEAWNFGAGNYGFNAHVDY